MAELQESHKKYKEDHADPTEALGKEYEIVVARDQQLREEKDELATTHAEIARLCGQLVCTPVNQDLAFAYDYRAGILRLRSYLLRDPGTNLTALD